MLIHSFTYVRIAILLFVVMLLGACAVKFGQDFDPAAFENWVKQGETTKSQVQDFLGAPTGRGIIMEKDGTKLTRYLYYYGKGKLSNMKSAKFKMLEVRFDDQNTVVSYNWSSAD